MPYTLAHPILIYPLKNKRFQNYFNFSALFFGAMSPDFDYFLNLNFYGDLGHHFPQTVWFCLITTFSACYLFHNLTKPALIASLPAFLEEKFSSYQSERFELKSKRDFLVFTYSALIGSFSHLFLDHFTHKTGFFVEKFEFLQSSIFGYQVFKLLQLGLGGLGILALIWFIFSLQSNHTIKAINPKTALAKTIWWILYSIFVFASSSIFAYSQSSFGIASLALCITAFGFLGLIISSFFDFKNLSLD